jgi:hypothetical protein
MNVALCDMGIKGFTSCSLGVGNLINSPLLLLLLLVMRKRATKQV